MQLIFQTARWRRPAMAAAAIVLVAAFAASHAAAQGRRGRQPEPPRKERLENPISGTLKQLIPARRLILVETAEKQQWLVQVTQKTTATVQGEVGLNFLRPGMTIRFYGKLARKTKTVEPVEEVLVVTRDANFRPGVFEVDADEGSDEEEETASDDAEEEDGSNDDADNDESTSTDGDGQTPKQRRSSRNRATREVPATRYWISGQLSSFKRGAMVVLADKSKVRADVNESTRVVVEAKDLRMARPGDAVVVHGSAYGPGKAEATKIEVTLAEPQSNERITKDPKTGKKNAEP